MQTATKSGLGISLKSFFVRRTGLNLKKAEKLTHFYFFSCLSSYPLHDELFIYYSTLLII